MPAIVSFVFVPVVALFPCFRKVYKTNEGSRLSVNINCFRKLITELINIFARSSEILWHESINDSHNYECY